MLLNRKASQWGTYTLISCRKRKLTRRRAVFQVNLNALWETSTEIFQTDGGVLESHSSSCSGLRECRNGLCAFITSEGMLKEGWWSIRTVPRGSQISFSTHPTMRSCKDIDIMPDRLITMRNLGALFLLGKRRSVLWSWRMIRMCTYKTFWTRKFSGITPVAFLFVVTRYRHSLYALSYVP